MTASLSFLARWQDATPSLVQDRVVVVLDVLRWSTVAVTALAHGAVRVEACAEPDDALARATALGRDGVVLGGERENVAIPGFDVGNSPLEYAHARVAGKVVVSTTTNGTHGLRAARDGAAAYVGAFVNQRAVIAALGESLMQGHGVALLACGSSGRGALEDTACAGAIIAGLLDAQVLELAQVEADARRALAVWDGLERSVTNAFAAAPHAQALARAGFEADLHAAGRVDAFDLLPTLGVQVTVPA
jgi:2-phosphosulfolactate phosphatase